MKYFVSIYELFRTDTGLENVCPSIDVVNNIVSLRTILSVLRLLIGCPLIINSGYRSEAVNSAVGGVLESKHLLGLAADIRCERMSTLKSICKEWYKKGVFSECVIHDNYIHVAI